MAGNTPSVNRFMVKAPRVKKNQSRPAAHWSPAKTLSNAHHQDQQMVDHSNGCDSDPDQSGHRLGNESSGPINGVESSSVPSTTAQSPQPLALSINRALPVDPPAFTLSVISRMRKGVPCRGSVLQHRPWGLTRKGKTGVLGAPPTRGGPKCPEFCRRSPL